MTEQRRFLDVWITETNTVYREVPYNVVSDWVQQGRLLENDKLRPSGTSEWFLLGSMPAFAAYLPRAEPFRAEDQAEALEPVQLDFAWRRPRSAEDDDVDMIPLIDVSLVLLIFFMMTATMTAAGSLIQTPRAFHGSEVTNDQQMLWIGIEIGAGGGPKYSLGQGSQNPDEEDRGLNRDQLLQRLDQRLAANSGPAEVRIKAHEDTPDGVIKQMRALLDVRKGRGLIRSIHDEVSEGDTP
jgi:biopolymer transport protein ExbD